MSPKSVANSLRLHRLQHIGLPVTDLAASRAFYEGLGFRDVMSATFDRPAGEGRVSMMQVGEITLELYQMPSAELAEVRARRNGHVDHIAFDVADIDAAFATLQQAGYRLAEPEPVRLAFWSNGCRYFNVLGPDGERLEFNQIL